VLPERDGGGGVHLDHAGARVVIGFGRTIDVLALPRGTASAAGSP